MGIEKSKVIVFAPHEWGSLDRFQRLHLKTYQWDKETQHALAGVGNHFRRANAMLRVGYAHIPKLAEDRAQLNEYGHTPRHRGEELSAIFESVILSLYSAIDCGRKVVSFIYRKERGVKQSTRKFFQAAKENRISNGVPLVIRNAFEDANWYGELRRLRDTLTHSDVGSCHLDEKVGKVFYMHSKLGSDRGALVIEDALTFAADVMKEVDYFLGQIFGDLNKTLLDEEVQQVCGFFGGRVYSRFVKPSEAVDFDSGRCEAFQWFEKDENPTCPFANTCGAYERRFT